MKILVMLFVCVLYAIADCIVKCVGRPAHKKYYTLIKR